MKTLSQPPTVRSAHLLRAWAVVWAANAVVPLPLLVFTDLATSVDVACAFLGLACGWLAAEIYRAGGQPDSRPAWRAKLLAIVITVATNVGLFIAVGSAAGVQTHFPFPLMAALSVIPAVGMVPWLMRVARQPYAAVILGAFLVFLAKLAACVVARIVYGPNYIAEGYVAGDWRTAKLMISLFWSFSVALSLALLWADYLACGHARSSQLDTTA
jgi:hypothetical protein